jgi:hypothetical protein
LSLTVGTPDPKFTLTRATISSVVQGAPDPDIWSTSGSFTFDATALATTGVPLASGGLPFATSEGQFKLDNIRFADPTGGDTSDAQVKLQGTLGSVPTLVGLSMSVGDSNFLILDGTGYTLTGVEQTLSGGLSVGGLGFDVSGLSVSYSDGQFTLTGSTSFNLENDSVTANFASPGLVVQGGVIQDFHLTMSGDLSLAGVSFSMNSLGVSYTQDTSTYTVTGNTSLKVDGQALSVSFGGGGTNGLTITNGILAELDVQVVSSFKLLGLEFDVGSQANPLTMTYTGAPQSIFTLAGEVSVHELQLGGGVGASVILGSKTQAGIEIKGGHFQLDDVTIQLSDVPLGAFTLDKLVVSFDQGLSVTVDVWFPEGWKLGGTVGFTEDGKLNTIGFGISGNEGIEIADTGIMITGISGEVQNLQHPSDLIVSGSLTGVWGTGQLITVSGGFKVDKDELVLDGSVSILDGYGSGSGRVVLDWGQHDYSIDVQLGWLDGVITGEVVIDLHDRDNLYVKATADVNVPDVIPVIGGKTLAGINFVLEWHSDPSQESFIAAWVDASFWFVSVDVGVKYDFGDSTPHVIGAHEIHNIAQPPPVNPQDQVYQYRMTFTVPANPTDPTPTNGLLHVRWPQAGGTQTVAITFPDGTTYDQSQFSKDNGITLMPQFSTGQQYVIGLAGSSSGPYTALPAGTYVVQLTSNLQFNTSDPDYKMLLSSFGLSRPRIDAPRPSSNTSGLEIPVTIKGKADSSLHPKVTLYYDDDQDGYDGTPIPGATNVEVTPGADGSWSITRNWNTDGLLPLPYYVYASINDGVNGTVHSAYSGSVTPSPVLSGNVSNPLNDGAPLGGIMVYLDENNNGRFDPGTDLYTSTNDHGAYRFTSKQLPPAGTTFYVAVSIPPGFKIDPRDENPKRFVYTGSEITADFDVDEFTAIHGTLYADFATGPQPLQGWTAYLDANANGALDPGEERVVTGVDGRYAFQNVPLNTTQTVRFQLQPGYYLTGSTPASYTVQVGGGQFTIYGNNDFAVLPFSTVSGNVAGYALQNGALSTNTTPLKGWTVQLASGVAIDAGGGANGSYQPDTGFAGSSQVGESTTAAIDTRLVTNPAPQGVYQTNRVAIQGGAFSYTLTGLTPRAPYTVRLHFAETFFHSARQRLFDVAINGQPVLDDFDIFAAAGNRANTAVARGFTATADATGTITIRFTSVTNNAQVNGIEVVAQRTGTAIDAGSTAAAGDYKADQGFTGGQGRSTNHSIFLGAVTDPAPVAVYQSNRFGPSFGYALTGLVPNAPYVVRLHFAETELDDAGDRLFRVTINGDVVLDQFDIFATADQANNGGGGKFVAIALPFGVRADASGTITLQFTGQRYNAQVNGIEVLGGSFTTTTDADGNYSFGNLFSGAYTVAEAVPPGWRQVAPFSSDLVLQTPSGNDVLPFPGQGGRPNSVAVADFNGDGKPDFAVLDPAQQQVFIYYDGDFSNPQGFTFDDLPKAIVAADFGGTGRPSIGVINFAGSLDVLRNDGGGSFQDVPDWFDLDYPSGIPATINGVWVGQFVPGNGLPQVAVLAEGEARGVTWTAVSVGFFDSNGNSAATSLYQDNFAASPPSGMAGGDVNGDGWTDLLVGFRGQPPLLLYGGPSAVGQQGQPVSGLPAGGPVVAGDISGDGLMDLGIFDANTNFHYAIQDQAGDFTAYTTAVAPPTTTLNAAMLQDVNGDLRPDLVFLSDGNGPQQALYVALNTGTTASLFTRAGQTAWSLAPGAQGGLALAAADLDADGLSDLIVVDTEAGNTEVVRNHSVTSTPALLAEVDGSASTGDDFLNAQVGQINGRVFDDLTRDGNSLLGKPGRAGATVYIDLNRNGRPDPREPRSVTGPDGYYAFSGLPAGTYQVRWIDEPNRRPTTPEGGVRQVRLLRRGQVLNGLDFGSAVSIDRRLAIPPDGSRDWTARANGGRLEVLDRVKGVVDSLPLEELNSLTILGTNGRSDRLTVDTRGGFFALRGGILFDGGAGPGDSLQVVLGPGNDVARFTNPRLVIDAGLVVRATQIEGLSIDAGAGDDRITLAGAPLRGVVQVDGGAGDDVLTGGAGNDILLGGAGDDVLFGQGGRDLLIGGLGRDLLLGGPGDDLLVAGATAFDRDAQALQAILAEWASGRDYATRVRNLTGTGNGNRANGDNFLEAATVPDDHVLDVLFGGADRNWFLSFPSDLLPDRRRDERIGW